MTQLQQILKNIYFTTWRDRNATATEIGKCLFRLRELRARLEGRQSYLLAIASELKSAGFGGADDYFTRVWPLAIPEEEPIDPNSIISE